MGVKFQICVFINEKGALNNLAPCGELTTVDTTDNITGRSAFMYAFINAREKLYKSYNVTDSPVPDNFINELLRSGLEINPKLEFILKNKSNPNDLITFYVWDYLIKGFKVDTLDFGSVLYLRDKEGRDYGGPTILSLYDDEYGRKQGTTSHVLLPYTRPDYSTWTNFEVLGNLMTTEVLELVLPTKEVVAFQEGSNYTNRTVGINDSMTLFSKDKDLPDFDSIRYTYGSIPTVYSEYSKVCAKSNPGYDLDLSVTDNFDVDITVECKSCTEYQDVLDTVYDMHESALTKKSMCESSCSRPSACDSSPNKTNNTLYFFIFAVLLVFIILGIVWGINRKTNKKGTATNRK